MNVKTLCLALLSHGAATGYEIKKQMEEGPTGYFYHAGYGSIYPALNTLEKDGMVACSTENQAGRPQRKVYELTDAGRVALTEAMAGTAMVERVRSDALFKLFFAEHLAPGRVQVVVDDYRAEVRELLDTLESEEKIDCRGYPGKEFVHGLGLTIYRAILDHLDKNRHMLDEKPSEVKKAS